MKKLFLFFLLIAGIVHVLPAQDVTTSNSELIFNSPKPGSLYDNFVFYFPKGNRMTLEMNSIHQLKNLPNLDSLARKVYEDLQVFKDSLTKELTTKRVDYITSKDGAKIRITEHQPASNYYAYKQNEPVQIKVDQDTLRIKLYVKGVYINENKTTPYSLEAPFCFVTFVVNNISDINNIPVNALDKALHDLLLKDMETQINYDKPKYEGGRYYAAYKIETSERIAPKSLKYLAWGRSSGFDPYIQVGLQNLRGYWAPSAGLGFSVFETNTRRFEKKIYTLMVEPYFFFYKDANNNSVTDKNTFLTFKYHTEFKNYRPNATSLMYENFSIGYLINRNGNWFEKNTFKISVPGLQTKNILLEPEFYFNDFFKHFSPSLKITLFFE